MKKLKRRPKQAHEIDPTEREKRMKKLFKAHRKKLANVRYKGKLITARPAGMDYNTYIFLRKAQKQMVTAYVNKAKQTKQTDMDRYFNGYINHIAWIRAGHNQKTR